MDVALAAEAADIAPEDIGQVELGGVAHEDLPRAAMAPRPGTGWRSAADSFGGVVWETGRGAGPGGRRGTSAAGRARGDKNLAGIIMPEPGRKPKGRSSRCGASVPIGPQRCSD